MYESVREGDLLIRIIPERVVDGVVVAKREFQAALVAGTCDTCLIVEVPVMKKKRYLLVPLTYRYRDGKQIRGPAGGEGSVLISPPTI
jgi:hypothetical protein